METGEVLFENSFVMTQERYLSLCNNPKAKKAVGQLRRRRILLGACTLYGLFMIVLSIRARQVDYIGIFLFLVAGYMLFFQRRIRNKQLYARVRKVQATDEWRRVTRFYDSCLEVEDANSTTKIGYDELTGMTQDGECGLLWRGEDYVIRVMRGEFTLGSYEDFTAFINGKIAENAEKKV